jgi:signal transduction histidine kinase/CheY-like chemotaxis protein
LCPIRVRHRRRVRSPEISKSRLRAKMIRSPNKQVYKNVVLIWISLSIASVILSGANWFQLSRELKAATQATITQDSINALFQSLIDAETAQRGFTITGDETFLEPLNQAEARLPGQFDKLIGLVHRDPTLLKRATELRELAGVSLAHQRNTVKLRREHGAKAAGDLVKSGQGKLITDAVRQKVNELREFQPTLASSTSRHAQGKLLQASLTSLVAGALGIGAGLLAFYLARVGLRQEVRERQLLQATLQAEHDSHEKSAFVANMSHEIRTPMNAILGFSELLSAEIQEPKHRHYLQSIRASAGALLHLINDILDMSKVDAGVVELHLEPTDPREVCEFITTMFGGPAAKKGIQLECHVADNLPRALLLDRVRFRQLVVNLVGNAIKFTDRGRIQTDISCERQTDATSRVTLVIQVEDTGVGIPKDRLDAIFKPFVQAGSHVDKDRMGTGLGLAIVQRMTRLMGGTVTVASVVGQGSAFHLRFPDIVVSARLPISEAADPLGPANFDDLQPAKILVVDDNETNCELVRGIFAGTHHQLEYGIDGIQAVEKAQSFRPDLVLLDIRMPKMNGREAVEEIHKRAGLELLPVIAVTASSLLDEEKSLRQVFSGYLRKPFTRRELFNELSVFLPKRAKPQEPEKVVGPAPALERSGQPPEDWRELAAQLRGLEVQEWPAVRDTLAVNETREFARRLETLARKSSCEPLLDYAQTLGHHAETYAVDSIEEQLQGFPVVIARVERSANET